MKKFPSYTIILLFGLYGLKLVGEHHLSIYIHKKYTLFFTTTSVFCVVAGVTGLIYAAYAFKRGKKNKKRTIVETDIGFLPVILTLLVGLLLPAKSLSASLGLQNTGPGMYKHPPKAAVNNPHIIWDFGSDTGKYTFANWYRIQDMDPDFQFMTGKRVKISGFYVKRHSDGTGLIGRLLITCCAVDASLFAFPMENRNIGSDIKENDWVEVTGIFKREVIIPVSVAKSEPPEDPYLYY